MRKNNDFSGFVFVFSFFVLLSFLANCSGEKSEEDFLLEAVDLMGNQAENRSLPGIMNYISADYADDEGRTVDDIQAMLQNYFSMYRGIAVNLLGKSIITMTVPEAEIEAEVALSSGAAQVFRKAVRYSGYFYRFKLGLVKEGEQWKVKKASWENINQDALLPESLKILKDLFPNAF